MSFGRSKEGIFDTLWNVTLESTTKEHDLEKARLDTNIFIVQGTSCCIEKRASQIHSVRQCTRWIRHHENTNVSIKTPQTGTHFSKNTALNAVPNVPCFSSALKPIKLKIYGVSKTSCCVTLRATRGLETMDALIVQVTPCRGLLRAMMATLSEAHTRKPCEKSRAFIRWLRMGVQQQLTDALHISEPPAQQQPP